MQTKTKIAALVAVVALAAIGTRAAGLWGASSNEVRSPETAVEVETAKPSATISAPMRIQSRGPQTQLEDDPVGQQRLEGQVIDDTEAPVAGALITINSVPLQQTKSEEDGSFVFTGLSPREYALEAHKEELHAGPLRLQLNANTEPAILRLRAGRTVAVHVRNGRDQGPLADATVEIRSADGMSYQSTTNSEGLATIAGVGAGAATLHARAQGFASASLRLTSDQVSVPLQPGVPVEGVVLNQEGEPVAGARVLAAPASDPFPVVDARRDAVASDQEGRFTLPALTPGSYRFSVQHPKYTSAEQTPIEIGETVGATIELRVVAGASLIGTVEDDNGAAVAGARVRFVVQGSIPWRSRRQAFSDEEGRFHFSALPPVRGDLVAASGLASSELVPVDLTSGGEIEVNLELSIAGHIAGVVVDSKGEEIPEAQLHIEPQWSGETGQREAWAVRGSAFHIADAGGRFRITGLPQGAYQLRAARPGATQAVLRLGAPQLVSMGSDDVQLTVAERSYVKGRVLYDSGEAPEVFTVSLDTSPAQAFASSDGRFRLESPVGVHRLRVTGPGFAPATSELSVEASAELDLGSITVKKGRVITGVVLDAAGEPVADCPVVAGALLTGDGSKLYIEDESIEAQATQSGEDGRFVLAGLGTHPVTVVAGNETGRSRYLRLPGGGGGADVSLILEPTSALRGVATRDGQPVAETVIIASPVGTNASNFVVSGGDGSFAFDQLTPGQYLVYPMIGGGGSKPKDMFIVTATVAEGAGSEVTIKAQSGQASIEVEALDSDGKPMPMAQVVLLQDDDALIQKANYSADALRNGGWLRGRGVEDAVAIYIRGAMGGPARVDNLRPGHYAACIAERSMGPPAPMTCKPVDVEEGVEQKFTVQRVLE